MSFIFCALNFLVYEYADSGKLSITINNYVIIRNMFIYRIATISNLILDTNSVTSVRIGSYCSHQALFTPGYCSRVFRRPITANLQQFICRNRRKKVSTTACTAARHGDSHHSPSRFTIEYMHSIQA